MSRVDVPTMKCDRCGDTTQDINEMSRYQRLSHSHMGGTDNLDLCPICWARFNEFIDGES